VSYFLSVYATRALLLLALGVAVDVSLRRQSAALRHLSWSVAVGAVLLVAPLTLAGPRLRIPVPGRWPTAGFSAADLARRPMRNAPREDRRTESSPQGPAGDFLTAESVVLSLWAAGALALLARLMAGRLRLRQLRRRCPPLGSPEVVAICREAARVVGCRRRVALAQGERTSVPSTFGLLRPVVLLPAGVEAWPEDRLRSVLLHELSHVARFDPLPQLLAELVCIVHWYNPLAWFAAQRLAELRERACDDRVLAAGIAAPDYAGHIVEAARQAFLGRNPQSALAIVRRSGLETRLREILDPAVPREPVTRSQRLRVLIAATVCAGIFGGVGFAPASVASPDERLLADPRSEVVPVDDLRAHWPSETEVRGSVDQIAIRRLQSAAAHVKTWEGDLVRERAEWALSQVRDGDLISPLVQALEDEDWRVQAYAAWALGVAGDRRAVAPLERLLDHPVWRVRAMALSALLELEADIPLQRLARLAADPAWQVRIEVVQSLRRQRGAEASALLRTMAAYPHRGTRETVRAALEERR
jgi:beta-lactamase regulating signal transducer with metallopeptidase domain